MRSTVGPETRGRCAGLPFPTVGRSGQDSLTRVASGLLAGAVVAVLGACTLIWWYRQAAFGWSAPNPRFWRLLELAAIGLATAALVLAVIAAVRRPTSSGRVGAITWAVVAAAILIAAPIVVGHQAPEGPPRRGRGRRRRHG